MEALDGNAVAGPLHELFGSDMTTATGTCRTCGNRAPMAEVRVYMRAPGVVARCRVCGSVLFVLSDAAGSLRIFLDGVQMD